MSVPSQTLFLGNKRLYLPSLKFFIESNYFQEIGGKSDIWYVEKVRCERSVEILRNNVN